MPRVSVAIPAYNAERFLRATLDSALAQTFSDLEVIVVNDGSSDATQEIAESLGAKVRVINQANAGMSASRNRAIEESDSEYIALLDSDDIWHPQKLQMQLAAFEARHEASFCFTGFDWWYGDDPIRWLSESRTDRIDADFSGWIYHQLILDNYALPSSWLLKRSAWNEIGPFLCENQQTDDWEYVVRASRSSQFVKLVESHVLYRQVGSSLSKRLVSVNVGEVMRERLIERFGLTSPNGQGVDLKALRLQRYKGWRNFADAHCARGEFRLGLSVFADLMRSGPRRAHTLASLLMACRRRLFPSM